VANPTLLSVPQTLATFVSVTLGIIVAVVGLRFTLFPNVEPVTGRELSIAQVGVEPSITLEDYARYTSQSLSPTLREPCIPGVRAGMQAPPPHSSMSSPTASISLPHGSDFGIAVHFSFTASGLRGECVGAKYVLFDGESGKRVTQTATMEGSWETELRDADVGTGALWIPNSAMESLISFVVRVELYRYSLEDYRRLTFIDSVKHCLPAALPCAESSIRRSR
jgi:hypothetical protein